MLLWPCKRKNASLVRTIMLLLTLAWCFIYQFIRSCRALVTAVQHVCYVITVTVLLRLPLCGGCPFVVDPGNNHMMIQWLKSLDWDWMASSHDVNLWLAMWLYTAKLLPYLTEGTNSPNQEFFKQLWITSFRPSTTTPGRHLENVLHEWYHLPSHQCVSAWAITTGLTLLH